MKKLNLFLVGCMFSAVSVFAEAADQLELLQGDKRLACEAILCLSSSEKPAECKPSLHRYFSIKAKKWKNTLKARNNFLKLCPMGEEGEKDEQFTKLRDEILTNLNNPCDVNNLNSNIEYTNDKGKYLNQKNITAKFARVSPKLEGACTALASSAYTNIRPKYVCEQTFWPIADWNRGYSLRLVDKNIYDAMKAKNPSLVEMIIEKDELGGGDKLKNHQPKVRYYVKEPIKKDCWVLQ